MKKLLLILLCLPMIGFGQQTYVPDDNFEQMLINQGYDAPPLDNYVYTSMINSVTSLNLNNNGVADFTGIQDFISLTYLEADGNNPATVLDLSNHPTLTYLRMDGSQVENINLSGCTALEDLAVGQNVNLTNLDLSGCTSLERLALVSSSLTSLDLSGLISLEELNIQNSDITNLNLNNCQNLHTILAANHNLSSLDLSTNISLAYFDITYSRGTLTDLDLSNCPDLWMLLAQSGQNTLPLTRLSSLNVSGTSLREIHVAYNNLISLDLSGQTKLELIDAKGQGPHGNPLIDNGLETVYLDDVGTAPISFGQGIDIFLDNNNLQYVDLSCVGDIDRLDLDYNPLTSLNLQNGLNQNINRIETSYTTGPLQCVQVDDEAWSFVNWGNSSQHQFPSSTNFSDNCGYVNCTPTSIQEYSSNKELLKVTDLLGRETKQTNQPLFYIYDDGTVEKRIVIE